MSVLSINIHYEKFLFIKQISLKITNANKTIRQCVLTNIMELFIHLIT